MSSNLMPFVQMCSCIYNRLNLLLPITCLQHCSPTNHDNLVMINEEVIMFLYNMFHIKHATLLDMGTSSFVIAS